MRLFTVGNQNCAVPTVHEPLRTNAHRQVAVAGRPLSTGVFFVARVLNSAQSRYRRHPLGHPERARLFRAATNVYWKLALSFWLVGLMAGSALGQQIPGVTDPESHSWARFGPRAWKVVRVKTETLNEQGEVERSSTRTTRIQVTRVTRRSCSLCVTSTSAIEGIQIAPEPKILTQTFDQNIISTKKLGSETLTIGNREYIVNVVRAISQRQGVTRTSTIYYSHLSQPEVLKRTTISKDAQTGDIVSKTEVAVTEVDRQRTILGESHSTWTVSIVFKQGDATTITTEVHCVDVPGELVSRTTTKRNSEGRVLTRSTLELVGYGSGRLRRVWLRHR